MTETQFTRGRPPVPTAGELRLPTPPGVARRFWARHPWLSDTLVASVYLVPMVILFLVDVTRQAGPGLPPQALSTAAVVLVITAALLVRRHAPLLVLGVTCAGLVAAFPEQGDTLPVLIALYAVAVYRGGRSAWFGLAGAVGVAALGAFVGASSYASWLAVASQSAVLMLAATLVGVTVGDRKRYVAALVELAAQLARERDQQAQLARITERGRIAREMHDIIAHSLSVMVALADGADALLVKDPERSRVALREVARTGRGSMSEMRRLLGVLGEDPQETGDPEATDVPLRPQPGADQLVDLVDSFRSAGLPARLERTGRIPGSQGLQLTVYRIVQESLTNALRYSAQPTVVSVRLTMVPGRLEVVVTDDGRNARDASRSPGTGRGLVGLRERVALYDGTLIAGRRPGGGWQVRATMTVDETEEQA
ncbi:two-component sensor histidine kinase [Cryobacterium sinapicolor]|uniref:histidine kinase n=1 Tax=Cryobacterium sinapicolor TaxID=1259236 RepID=A0ABY2J3Y9_9MICO|nr:histidine kinase [Cryobacterium sinapicolor]TFC99652.1 two-component sensor histidine kinase [Cryobacterium sinapicolor]